MDKHSRMLLQLKSSQNTFNCFLKLHFRLQPRKILSLIFTLILEIEGARTVPGEPVEPAAGPYLCGVFKMNSVSGIWTFLI